MHVWQHWSKVCSYYLSINLVEFSRHVDTSSIILSNYKSHLFLFKVSRTVYRFFLVILLTPQFERLVTIWRVADASCGLLPQLFVEPTILTSQQRELPREVSSTECSLQWCQMCNSENSPFSPQPESKAKWIVNLWTRNCRNIKMVGTCNRTDRSSYFSNIP